MIEISFFCKALAAAPVKQELYYLFFIFYVFFHVRSYYFIVCPVKFIDCVNKQINKF